MSKNVLVITGSPRKGGNTELMADAFIKGAEEAGHGVIKFEAGLETIFGCDACDTCWSTGHACTHDDGFRKLEPLLEAADVIVFASPIYFYGIPAQLKAPVDKLYAYLSPACKRPLKIREMYFLVCGETDIVREFNGAIDTMGCTARFMEWKFNKVLIVTEVSKPGDILDTGNLEKAEELGRSL